MFSFVCLGNPIPKARPRVFRGHAITPARTKNYEKAIAKSAKSAIPTGWGKERLVEIEVVFYRQTLRRADVDNLLKSLMDGLIGVLYNDDCQVIKATTSRFLDRKNPRAEVTIREV